MISCISNEEIAQTIEAHSVGIGHRRCRHCHSERSADTPLLDARVARVQDIHESILIEADRCWTTELIRPRTRIAGRAGHSRAHIRS